MQKPPTRTDRQTAVGELGPDIAAGMCNDHNYIIHITSYNIEECANQHVCV